MALSDNLVHYYKFDESSGNASDSVGSVTLTNVGTVPYASAKINNGITPNGSSSYMHSGSSTVLSTAQLKSTWSVNFWLKRIGNPAGASYVFRINGETAADAYFIMYYYATGGYHINCGADAALTYTDTGNLDMITIVYNGAGTISYYINNNAGTGVSFTVGGAATTTNKFGIGNDPDTGAPFNAQYDEFGIWTRALTTGDISSLYNSGTGLQYPFTVAPTGHTKNLLTLGVG
jgi:hypothetical protein